MLTVIFIIIGLGSWYGLFLKTAHCARGNHYPWDMMRMWCNSCNKSSEQLFYEDRKITYSYTIKCDV